MHSCSECEHDCYVYLCIRYCGNRVHILTSPLYAHNKVALCALLVLACCGTHKCVLRPHHKIVCYTCYIPLGGLRSVTDKWLHASVVGVPSVLSAPAQVDAKYSVQFEDNTYAEGYAPPLPVPQRFVIPSKETRKARS